MTSSSNSLLLSQALRDNDDKELSGIVQRVKDYLDIEKTLKELPEEDVLPLLNYIDTNMRQQKLSNLAEWLIWVQKAVYIYRDYLATVPDIVHRMSQMVEWMERRARNLDKLLQLHGKLKFFTDEMQEELNNKNSASRKRPLLAYDLGKGVIEAQSAALTNPPGRGGWKKEKKTTMVTTTTNSSSSNVEGEQQQQQEQKTTTTSSATTTTAAADDAPIADAEEEEEEE